MLTRFLQSSADLLPYTQSAAKVSLAVGSELGGGFEWTSTNARDRGVVTLEVHPVTVTVTVIDVMWNGALAADEVLLSLAQRAIER